MNANRLWIPLSFVLVTGIGAQQANQQEAQKEDLSEKVASQQLRIELLEQDLEAVQTYLAAQAESAKALAKTMDEADAAGFAWGINPDAHKFVLTGIRSFSASVQKDVPAPKKEDAPEPDGRRRPRRR